MGISNVELRLNKDRENINQYPRGSFEQLMIIGIAFAVIGALVVGLLLYITSQPSVPKNYTEKVKTGGDIEKKYMWYPNEIMNSDKKYPVVVFANGTGVKASKYKALFEHLASWGFICIGTEDEYAWNGFSAEMCIRILLYFIRIMTFTKPPLHSLLQMKNFQQHWTGITTPRK